MTLPDERYRAVQNTRRFLQDLMDPKKTPKIPRSIRQQAYAMLRHYPNDYDLELLSEKSPDVIIKEMEPLTRMMMSYEKELRS
jgi:hypothetical protein